MKNLLSTIDNNVIYAILFVIIIAISALIGCWLVNRNEKRDRDRRIVEECRRSAEYDETINT